MSEPSSHPPRRIALVSMTLRPDAQELGNLRLPSDGIRRIDAALLSDPDLARVTVPLFDRATIDIEAYVADILDFEPDLVGFSIYVRSAPAMIAVARALRARRPSLAVVFGGPSARPAFFDLEPHRPAHTYLDAVVEGEETFLEIVSLERRTPAALGALRGVACGTARQPSATPLSASACRASTTRCWPMSIAPTTSGASTRLLRSATRWRASPSRSSWASPATIPKPSAATSSVPGGCPALSGSIAASCCPRA